MQKPNIDELRAIDINSLVPYFTDNEDTYEKRRPLAEAYRLYAWLTTKLKKDAKIADLGTCEGFSALALTYSGHKVTSYDLDITKRVVKHPSIKFLQKNMFDDIENILKSDLILVDVDPHDGVQEKELYDILVEKKYKGITVWDDIIHFSGMQRFWASVEREKLDFTDVGHWSGTGLIKF